MEPKIYRIRELMKERKWSDSELARQMGVSKSEVTRLLNGKRKGGNKVIGGLKRAFPDEPLESLFYFARLYPNVNTVEETIAVKELPGSENPRRIKHPKAHQLACTVDEYSGRIEIIQGENLTVLTIPPGSVGVEYSTVHRSK